MWKSADIPGRFWKWWCDFEKGVKNRGMSGDTYLFRRSPSIDRLGQDCPKLTSWGDIWMLGMGSRVDGLEGSSVNHRLEDVLRGHLLVIP